MAYLLALLSAAAYGAADFLGGLASKSAPTLAVVFISQASGLAALVLMLPLLPASAATADDLWWGLAAGVTGSIGVALLYRALAVGTMAIVAPTTAVCAVIIPVLAGLVGGERPGPRVLAGIVIALVAIVLVSQANSASARSTLRLGSWALRVGSSPGRAGGGATVPRGLGLALLSGVAIGLFFLTLAQTATTAGLWPLVVARATSLALFGPLVVRRRQVSASRGVFAIAVAGGMLDMLANALYLIAVREGPLTAVVTLSSLYPASTVLLARVVLHERLRAVQMAGVAAALVAVVLIVG